MIRWIIVAIIIFVLGFCIYAVIANRLPKQLGIEDGMLTVCPSSPNCVSSHAPSDDETHYSEPLVYQGDRQAMQLKIESYMLDQDRVRLVSSSFGYVHFEVKSQLIGYIDDVEFYLPEEGNMIHFRSASRVGYSDRGVNRARMTQIRKALIN